MLARATLNPRNVGAVRDKPTLIGILAEQRNGRKAMPQSSVRQHLVGHRQVAGHDQRTNTGALHLEQRSIQGARS